MRKITSHREIARVNRVFHVYLPHKTGKSGESDSRKDYQSTKLERRPRILVKLSFRELCISKSTGWSIFDNIAISLNKKKYVKMRKVGCEWITYSYSNFCDPDWELICCKKWHPVTSTSKIAIRKYFHARHGSKITPILLHVDGGASQSLSSISVPSGDTAQPENSYSCILTGTSQVWVTQKILSINIYHSYHQHSYHHSYHSYHQHLTL